MTGRVKLLNGLEAITREVAGELTVGTKYCNIRNNPSAFQIYTQVAIRKLKGIHTATEPAKMVNPTLDALP